jgi:hypothetical protein
MADVDKREQEQVASEKNEANVDREDRLALVREMSQKINEYLARQNVQIDASIQANVITLQRGTDKFVIEMQDDQNYMIRRGGNRPMQVKEDDVMAQLVEWAA